MREIVLIADHPTSTERLDRLLLLIQQLKGINKKVALASHILVPNFIIERCDYFLFDKENEYNSYEEKEDSIRQQLYVGDTVFSSFEFYVPHKDKDYRFSASKQLLLSINYLKNVGYELIHYIEGDMLIDISELEENKNIMLNSEYESVIYLSNVCMCGGFLSFLTKNIDMTNLLPIVKVKDQIPKYSLLENFHRENLIKNSYIKNFGDYNFLSGLSTIKDNDRLRHSFFKIDDNWNFLLWNPSNKLIRIKIISTINEMNCEFDLNPTLVNFIKINQVKDDDLVCLFVNNTLYKEYKLDSLMSEFKYNKVEKV